MTDESVRIQPSADVDDRASLGTGTTVWHLAQVREGATLGERCIVGRGAYVDAGVRIGRNVKIQNHALVYAPATLGDGVFVGPAAVLTNDVYPRSVTPDGELKGGDEWDAAGVTADEGASIGARAVILAGVSVGAWALVGAGAVVIRDVPPHGLVVGNPARRIGWVGRTGRRLEAEADGRWRCPDEDLRYEERAGALVVST